MLNKTHICIYVQRAVSARGGTKGESDGIRVPFQMGRTGKAPARR